MDSTIEKKNISLSLVSVQLDGKKVTNAILDQIPRLDLCDLLVDEQGDYDHTKNAVPVCRFSLQHLLNSQRRIYKTKGYLADSVERLIELYSSQEEAYLFTYQNELYCDTYSSKTGTIKYGNIHKNLEMKINGLDADIRSCQKIVELHEKGVEPINIVRQCKNPPIPLPKNRARKALNHLEDWDDDLIGYNAGPEEFASHELSVIIKKHGGWNQYIDGLNLSIVADMKTKIKYERDLEAFELNVSETIGEVIASPFAILSL